MPQMSPMNWIIISNLMFISIMLMMPLMNKKTSPLKKKNLLLKNMSWKW